MTDKDAELDALHAEIEVLRARIAVLEDENMFWRREMAALLRRARPLFEAKS